MSGLWCRLVALTSTRPRLGVLECGVRWHMEHWGCKDSSEGLQGGGSWIPPGSWNPQGVSEANFVFNYSWWHFGFVLKATSEPPLLSQLLCSWVWKIWTAGPEDKTRIMPLSSRAEPQQPGTWGTSQSKHFPSKGELTLKLTSSSKSPPSWLFFGTVFKIHHWKEITCNPCFHKLH